MPDNAKARVPTVVAYLLAKVVRRQECKIVRFAGPPQQRSALRRSQSGGPSFEERETQRLRWIAAVVSAALDSRTMAHSRKPPSWSPVTIERDGKAYSGKFYVDGRLITVLYNGRTKTTQFAGSDATAVASRLLSELLPEK